MVSVHEHKGPYLGSKTFPGMSDREIKEKFANVNTKGVSEQGWYKVRENPETLEELY